MDRFDIIVFLDRLHDTHRPKEERDDAYRELLDEFERLRGALKNLGVDQYAIDNKPRPGGHLVTILGPKYPEPRELKSSWKLSGEDIMDALALGEGALIEKLAALEHEQWAHWTKYMLDYLHRNARCNDGFCIECGTPDPEDHVEECSVGRWMHQIDTAYEQLSEKEKKSDQEWARKVLNIIDKEG